MVIVSVTLILQQGFVVTLMLENGPPIGPGGGGGILVIFLNVFVVPHFGLVFASIFTTQNLDKGFPFERFHCP